MTKDYLMDAKTGKVRYRVDDLLATGRSYQLVRVSPVQPENAAGGPPDAGVNDSEQKMNYCARAILYDAELVEDPAYVLGRRQAMRDEWDFLHTLKSPLLPAAIDFFEAAEPGAVSTEGADNAAAEPVMVVEWQEGPTLFEWIRREHPDGLHVVTALSLFTELIDFLATLHAAGYVLRDLDPRHFLLSDDPKKREMGALTGELIVGIAGFGNATPINRPANLHKDHYAGSPYVAPEIRGDHEPDALNPAADNYSMGALMSFVLTGEEPREVVENPLNQEAYDKLSNEVAPGLAMLIARLMQPNPARRLATIQELAQYVGMDSLPTRLVEGFENILLPAPFSGAEDPKHNRALLSKLSPGPLISVEAGSVAAQKAQKSAKFSPEKKPRKSARQLDDSLQGEDFLQGELVRERLPMTWTITAVVLALITVALLIVFGVI